MKYAGSKCVHFGHFVTCGKHHETNTENLFDVPY